VVLAGTDDEVLAGWVQGVRLSSRGEAVRGRLKRSTYTRRHGADAQWRSEKLPAISSPWSTGAPPSSSLVCGPVMLLTDNRMPPYLCD